MGPGRPREPGVPGLGLGPLRQTLHPPRPPWEAGPGQALRQGGRAAPRPLTFSGWRWSPTLPPRRLQGDGGRHGTRWTTGILTIRHLTCLHPVLTIYLSQNLVPHGQCFMVTFSKFFSPNQNFLHNFPKKTSGQFLVKTRFFEDLVTCIFEARTDRSQTVKFCLEPSFIAWKSGISFPHLPFLPVCNFQNITSTISSKCMHFVAKMKTVAFNSLV